MEKTVKKNNIQLTLDPIEEETLKNALLMLYRSTGNDTAKTMLDELKFSTERIGPDQKQKLHLKNNQLEMFRNEEVRPQVHPQ